MTEALIRRSKKKRRNFSIIDNRIINHPSLSWEAKIILIYLLSKPDDWRVMPTELANSGNWGKGKIYQIINELIRSRYIKKGAIRKSGQFVRHEYIVYEIPCSEPFHENPKVVEAESSFAAEPLLADKTLPNTEYTKDLNNQTHPRNNSESRLITLDWEPEISDIQQIAFNANVSEAFVYQCANGFMGHFNGQCVENVTGELMKWVVREKKFTKESNAHGAKL